MAQMAVPARTCDGETPASRPWRALRLGRLYTLLLFLRMGRYAWLLTLAAATLASIPLLASREVVWWGVMLWIVALGLLAWAGSILSQFPIKFGIVRRFRWKAQHGEFEPDDLMYLCGDPCYRLVASEILRHTPHRNQRHEWVARLREKEGQFGIGSVRVDPERGVLVFFNGKKMG